MNRHFFPSISEKNARVSLFLFFSLLFLSAAFFVFADDAANGKNIFQDSDQDGLSNDEERLYGTDPLKKDTDDDGYGDGVEVESGYDPLKKAPGDKIVTAADISASNARAAATIGNGTNLTEQASAEIASVLKSAGEGGGEVSMDQINDSVQGILSGNFQDVQLPEVDMSEIKIKKAPSKKLGEKSRKEKEREDALEYLTVMAYLLANNSPRAFRTGDDLNGLLSSLSDESIAALASGNTKSLDQLAERGEKILEETKTIEVPEGMLDIHVKALKMAKYAVQLKGELQPNQSDPLGQITTLSKAQGFIGAAISFSDEIQKKFTDYGIEQIPLDL